MQTTSALWKRLWAAGARLEAVAVIDGATCDAITAPVIHRALMQEGLSVGNAVSATCAFTLRAAGSIPRAAEVRVKMRLRDGDDCSEWLAAGTFYVSHRSRDAVTGLTALECYDAMLKANAEFPRDGQWPRPMAQVVGEIAGLLGVEQDARNSIRTGDDYRVLLPEAGATIREVLGGIGAVHGGNWIITPENRLRLVPLGAGAAEAAVLAVLGGVSAGPEQVVTGLRVTGIGEERMIGNTDGLVVEIGSPFATEGSLAWLAERLIGLAYQPYALRGAIYDPAAELGDAVTSKEDVASALYGESATLGPAFRGDLSAPEPGELADEYPYLGATDRLRRLREEVEALSETKADAADVAAAEARANAVTAALGRSLTQQELFNRLTNNGETQGIYLRDGKLYLNGTYIDTGVLNADLLRAGIITDESGQNYWILDGANSEFVTRKGVIGDFLLEDGSLQYGSLNVGGTGAYIGRNGVIYNRYMPDSGDTAKVETYSQGLNYYWNGAIRKKLYINDSTLVLRSYDANGNFDYPLTVYDDTTKDFYVRYNLIAQRNFILQGVSTFNGKVTLLGDLEVRGTKNRRVGTADYGERLLYAYETASPMFGDVGEGVIGEDGRCHVWLDAVFAETVSTDRYQVFLQRYGAGDCRVGERRGGCFVVEGTPGLRFGWEVKARQRDFDQRRLDRAADNADRTGTDYGERALQYINRLREGRIPA